MYNHPWPPVSAYRMQHVVPNTQGPEHFGPPALCFLVPSPFGFGPPMRPYQVHPNQRTQRVAHPSLIQSPSSSEATRSDSAIPSSYDSRILDLWNSWLADTKPQMLARRQKMRQTEPSLPKIRARFLRWKELIEILRSEQSSACGSNNSVLETELTQLQRECSAPNLVDYTRRKVQQIAKKRRYKIRCRRRQQKSNDDDSAIVLRTSTLSVLERVRSCSFPEHDSSQQ
ncbi:hypothetical protein FBUS_09232 [Fasciolopsis buskii]|uniref:Uncharacterized protein n=1 Tax=Fasciolopsis buskii TaxID=27845 RepID=A0A8E0S1P6_9TREM|nr:hypothetical protein FBUS_09232 [Fasciolopsis buski]